MKTLFLIRHAKSNSGYLGMPDHDRPLNHRGFQAAVAMGQRMSQRKLLKPIAPNKPHLYLVSLFAILVLLSSACGSLFGPEDSEPTPSPTAVPFPTFTPTNTPSEPPTAIPAQASENTPVPPQAIEQDDNQAEASQERADSSTAETTNATETSDGEAGDALVTNADESTSDASESASDSDQPAKTLGSLLNADSTEATETTETTETETTETTESTESADSTEATEATDGADEVTTNNDADNAQPEANTTDDEPASDQPLISSEPIAIVAGELVNVRAGPSTAYELVGSAAANEEFPIVGRNELGDWWQVCCVDGDTRGWLYGPLVQVQNVDNIAVAVDIPPLPTPVPTAVPVAAAPTAEPVEETTVAEAEAPAPEPVPPSAPSTHAATAGNFDPNAEFHIVHYHVRGFNENNGGIFNNGGQHMIFITVLDENGNGIDGAVVKDTLADSFSITTGNKGPGKTEFEMFWEPYKLTVASIPSGPVTSQVTNQMNTAKPHIPDIIGRMGPPDHEYAICPTPDDRCEPPFFHAHWSYEITFQKVR